jgi:DNA helicase HerA-like ATPase
MTWLNKTLPCGGTRAVGNDEEVRATPYRHSILIVGASASGKSTVVAGILEQFAEQNYQFCLVDPEGDYENFAGALSFGLRRNDLISARL